MQRLIRFLWIPLPPLLMAVMLFAGTNAAVLEDYPSLPGYASLIALPFLAGIAFRMVKVLVPGTRGDTPPPPGGRLLLIIPAVNYLPILVHFYRITRQQQIHGKPGLLAAAIVLPLKAMPGVF